MNYSKFMHGEAAKASGPVTATDEDKRLGYPAFAAMKQLKPDFFIGTGDIVCYDNNISNAKELPQLRRCWHEQFRFPRMIQFFANTPGYWSKDDHDFRFNDSDLAGQRHFLRPLSPRIRNFMTFCGDRHWQFHSVHRSGVEEFACGALNDANSRVGVKAGSKKGTDPQGLIKQPYTYPKPSGGFLDVEAGNQLKIEFHNAAGDLLYSVTK